MKAAETSPVYLAIPVVGILVSAVVGGVTGKLATELRKKIKEDSSTLAAKRQEFTDLGQDISFFETHTTLLAALSKDIGDMLTVVQSIKRMWASISNDLGYIADNGITEAKLKAFKVKECLNQWIVLQQRVDISFPYHYVY